MPMNDDPSDLADWGEEEEAPQDTAESTGGVEADAVSLGGDDDDFEALHRYHQKTWDDNNQVQESQTSSVAPPPTEPEPKNALQPPPRTVRGSSEANTSSSGKETSLNPHGLPPKPQSPLGLRTVSVGATSISAVAMAPRTNGNQKHNESEKDSSQSTLPPGWEERISRRGERYYYDTVTDHTTWDHPLKSKSTGQPRTDSERYPSKPDKGNPSATEPSQRNHRSRSPRSRKRRSPSPRPIPQRRRSRSLERGSGYRPGRDSPPRKEPPRLPRDAPTTRPRGRQSSLERPRSPRFYRGVDHYSPPRPSRDERDRRERRPEIAQSSSTRHRSPPRTRSQERSNYRPMEIDHYEPPSHGTVRRRRSWGSPDAADIKRRRVQEPAPRGIDRYVPERSKNDRMDLDPPIHSVNDTKRSSGPENSTTHPRDSSPPPYRRANDPPAFSDKPLPPPHAERTQSSTSSQIKRDNQDSVIIQRSRGPLPPQSTAMRLGNRKRPEDISQGISQKHQTPEQAPRGPRADRERVSGRVTPPLASADRAPQHQRQDRSIEPQSYTERGSISRTERGRQGDAPKPDVTERHTGTTSRSSQQPGQGSSREFPSNSSKGNNDAGRGKGRGPKPQATSRSNNVPISDSRSKFGQAAGQSEQPARNLGESNPTSEPISQNQGLPDEREPSVPRIDGPKARMSRFGPKQNAMTPALTESLSVDPSSPVLRQNEEDPSIENSLSTTAHPSSSHREEYTREVGYASQSNGRSRDLEVNDTLASPIAQTQAPHEDGSRVDGDRSDATNDTRTNNPTVTEEPKDIPMRQDLGQPSPVEVHSQSGQPLTPTEQERPDTIQSKGSLLERLAPGPAAGQSGGRDDATGQEGVPGGEAPEKTRSRRRRSGRANRR